MFFPFAFVQAQQVENKNISNGEKIYYDYSCYGCHGYNGTGRVPLANGVSAIASNKDIFMVYLRQRAELNPVLPSTSMPNYDAKTLNDSQVNDLFAYINSLNETLPDVDEDPLMQKILRSSK
jgi:mono/diheme cytochrome c family protein